MQILYTDKYKALLIKLKTNKWKDTTFSRMEILLKISFFSNLSNRVNKILIKIPEAFCDNWQLDFKYMLKCKIPTIAKIITKKN